jgi:5-methylcytosine-specific restriction endonuclease McrA
MFIAVCERQKSACYNTSKREVDVKTMKNLSDKELLNRLETLVRKEHDVTLEILPHLLEVDQRKLYLELGYSSIYRYCREHLNYSESSTNRRLAAARCCKRFPKVYALLAKQKISLVTTSIISGILNEENLDRVLSQAMGKTHREVRALVAMYKPAETVKDRAIPVRVPCQASAQTAGARLKSAGDLCAANWQDPYRHGGGKESSSDERTTQKAQAAEPEYEVKLKLICAVSPEIMNKLERCKSLLSGKHPTGLSMETLMAELAEVFLEHRDPERRMARRKKRQDQQKSPIKAAPNPKRTRHIPVKEQDKVWVRDKGQCAFVGPSGRRCMATHNLQIDHYPTPYARGGPNTASNLRLLCAKHNQHTAEEVFGERHMAQYRQRE